MPNFSGYFLDIVARKLQDVVFTNQDQVQKETRMMILLQIISKAENPAFRAALITALKSSQTLDSVKNEIENPSFHIDNFETPDINRPSDFTVQFNPYYSFQSQTYNEESTVYPTAPRDVIRMKIGQRPLAKITMPDIFTPPVD